MPGAVFLTLMLMQGPPAEAGDAAQLERIRRELAEAPPIGVSSPLAPEGFVFRVTVHGNKPDKPMWQELSTVPPYVRSRFPSYHYQFLHQVTPEAFRAATLYPIGVPIDQLVLFVVKGIKAADRQRREGSAREEARRDFEEFLACRADPARPGC